MSVQPLNAIPDQIERDVLIVGAGISGVGAAWHLQDKCPDQSYEIIEARADMGGTWDLFRYPGIRSDSDMYTFGYAFRPWTDGSIFADGPSIRKYIKSTANDNGITDNIRFNTQMVSASWDTGEARWTVTAQHGDQTLTYKVGFLFMCTGYYRYDKGYLPEFEGYADFKGQIMHPQHWDERQSYEGKKIVIIGSGATAVTLVPSMADKASHITMLQRSPTYIAARPSVSPVSNFFHKYLPDQTAHMMSRIFAVAKGMWIYGISRAAPNVVKKAFIKQSKELLGEDYPVEKHLQPSYDPWDQRICAAPDGDFFKAIKSGKADIATDHIERFTESGIQLKSGEHLDADIIIPATGLAVRMFGGASFEIDGQPFHAPDHFTYRGMMLSHMPNFALAVGYTNASWTLKIDLTCERVCRMLKAMQTNGSDYIVAEPPADLGVIPMLNLTSGYLKRVEHELPRQGAVAPWRTYQNYLMDMMSIRYGKLEDGAIRFGKAGDRPSVSVPAPQLAEAAE
jgi:cation diffusion facilitator CzcD-associated flavoprotein CzcO